MILRFLHYVCTFNTIKFTRSVHFVKKNCIFSAKLIAMMLECLWMDARQLTFWTPLIMHCLIAWCKVNSLNYSWNAQWHYVRYTDTVFHCESGCMQRYVERQTDLCCLWRMFGCYWPPLCVHAGGQKERERRSDTRRQYTVCFGLHTLVWDHNSEHSQVLPFAR